MRELQRQGIRVRPFCFDERQVSPQEPRSHAISLGALGCHCMFCSPVGFHRASFWLSTCMKFSALPRSPKEGSKNTSCAHFAPCMHHDMHAFAIGERPQSCRAWLRRARNLPADFGRGTPSCAGPLAGQCCAPPTGTSTRCQHAPASQFNSRFHFVNLLCLQCRALRTFVCASAFSTDARRNSARDHDSGNTADTAAYDMLECTPASVSSVSSFSSFLVLFVSFPLSFP